MTTTAGIRPPRTLAHPTVTGLPGLNIAPEMIIYQAKSLRSFLVRITKWQTFCDAYGRAGDNGASEAELDAMWKAQPPMPSKNAKHRAYSDADWLVRYTTMNVERGADLDYLRRVLAAV
jgi:hypothetical protein